MQSNNDCRQLEKISKLNRFFSVFFCNQYSVFISSSPVTPCTTTTSACPLLATATPASTGSWTIRTTTKSNQWRNNWITLQATERSTDNGHQNRSKRRWIYPSGRNICTEPKENGKRVTEEKKQKDQEWEKKYQSKNLSEREHKTNRRNAFASQSNQILAVRVSNWKKQQNRAK